jgi:hypothetical protein
MDTIWIEDLILADDLRTWADRGGPREARLAADVIVGTMGQLPAALSAEHAELLRGYRLDQERRGCSRRCTPPSWRGRIAHVDAAAAVASLSTGMGPAVTPT